MNVKYIEGDLFDNINVEEGVATFITHVTNNQGGWGSGFVLPLAAKYPEAEATYRAAEKHRLGHNQYVEVEEGVTVVNMCAQTLGGKRPLFYNSLVVCMEYLVLEARKKQQEFKILAPMFGSGLAGGDWNIIEQLIDDCWLKRDVEVTVCYLPQFLPKNWTLPPPSTIVVQEVEEFPKPKELAPWESAGWSPDDDIGHG